MDQTPPWWYCMMDNNLLAPLSIEATTNSDQTPYAEKRPQTCKDPPPFFSVAWRRPLALSTNKLPLWETDILTASFFLQPSSCVFCEQVSDLALFSHQKNRLLSASLPWRPLLTWLLWPVNGCATGCAASIVNVFFVCCVYLHFRFSALAIIFLCLWGRTWIVHVETCLSQIFCMSLADAGWLHFVFL